MPGTIALKTTIIILFTVTIMSWSNASYIHMKAELAQLLLEVAWQKTLDVGGNSKPWPWADTWPIARLSNYKLDDDLLVLAGAHGSSLAFGPGHMDGTILPGSVGTSVIAGHRDTHFRFLERLETGDTMLLQNRTGEWHVFSVGAIEIKDSGDDPTWILDLSRDEIHLVTCYPFDAISPGGPLRYIVTLVRVIE
jgi:sortase A